MRETVEGQDSPGQASQGDDEVIYSLHALGDEPQGAYGQHAHGDARQGYPAAYGISGESDGMPRSYRVDVARAQAAANPSNPQAHIACHGAQALPKREAKPARIGFGGWYRQLFRDMKGLVRTRGGCLAFSAIVIVVTFAGMVMNGNICIDTETMVNIPGTILNWFGIGREGMVASKYVLGTLSFNMYWAQVLGMALLLASVFAWCLLLYRLGARRKAIYVLFPVVFATHPIFVEQFYFTTQFAEFNLAMLMIPVALILVTSAAKDVTSTLACGFALLALLLFFWAFASYQSFLALALAGGSLCALLMGRQGASKREFGLTAALFAATYVIAAIAYIVVTRLWFTDSDYLTSQIQWGVEPVSECISTLLGVIEEMALGDGVFYTCAFALAAIVMVACFAWEVASGRRKGLVAPTAACLFLLLASPFLLPALMANAPAARTAFTLPFATAACLALSWETLRSVDDMVAVKRFLVAAVCVVLGFSQVSTSLRLVYTNDVAYRQSVEFATVMCHDIDIALGGSASKPVVFVGCWEPELDNSCLKGEYIGTTELHWGDASLPHYHRSTEIIENWLESIGHTYAHPTEQQVIEARKAAHTMGLFADTGEVYDAGEFLVVKLGPDLFYSEDIA